MITVTAKAGYKKGEGFFCQRINGAGEHCRKLEPNFLGILLKKM
jgi:hypothetical protein